MQGYWPSGRLGGVVKPRLTVIMVNWNAAAKTLRMIHSIDEPDFDLRIEVLDNASADGDFRLLADGVAGLPNVRLHRSRRNLGFGRANNLLLRRSLTPEGYTVVANNDLVCARGAITTIIHAMLACQRRVATSTVCYLDQPQTIWYGGGTNRVEPRFRHRHAHIGQDISVLAGKKPHDVGFASGAWMVVENSVFRQTYLFDKFFFFGEEDSEFCSRLAGLKIPILFVPSVVVLHEVGVSSNSRKSAVLHTYHVSSKVYNVAKTLHPVASTGYVALFLMYQLLTAASLVGRRKMVATVAHAYLRGRANRGISHALI